jgi:hypothetical protein
MNMDAQPSEKPETGTPAGWIRIGTVFGNTSTSNFSFILRSFHGKLGDIVAVRVEVPVASERERKVAVVWGRVIGIDRFNPFFPAEAAQELADQDISMVDTVLSGSRDHLEAEVLILGTTFDGPGNAQLSPLTYPVKPSAAVLYPKPEDVRRLLTGQNDYPNKPRPAMLRIGILAMTGGGKTVAARRIIRELIDIGYPLVIFDPHGDYLGFFEKRKLFPKTSIRILYPMIRVWQNNVSIIADLIDKMGKKLTDAQQQFYYFMLNAVEVVEGEAAATYIERLIDYADSVKAKKIRKDEHLGDELADTRPMTMNAVKRSLTFVRDICGKWRGTTRGCEASGSRIIGSRRCLIRPTHRRTS